MPCGRTDGLGCKPHADSGHFDPANRSLFAFAAYNAGPGRISRMCTEATTDVRNIYKCYVACKLSLAMGQEREKAKQQVKPAS